MQLYQLLCSSYLEAEATSILNLLLNRNMPYQRCTQKTTFHASFRAPDLDHHPASPLYSCHTNCSAAPSAVKEVVDLLDASVSRFVTDAVGGFNDVSIVVSQGESLDLLSRANENEGIAAHRAVIQ
jgi:hypothetical protein